jgi:hypothetical protein
MQISTTLLLVVAELYILLIVGIILLILYVRKLKTLIRRQLEKLLSVIEELQASKNLVATPVANYKVHLSELIAATSAQYATIAPKDDINTIQPVGSPLSQRTLALRYAFLRAEELGTTQELGSNEYWTIFQQALEPLLCSPETDQVKREESLE